MLRKFAAGLLAFGFASLTWAQSIDLNKATEVELDGLKGVGPVLTQQVMTERKKSAFTDWDDVTRRVKGIGPQKAKSLSEQGVRVNGQTYAGKAANKKSAPSADKAATPKATQPKDQELAADKAKEASKSAAQAVNAQAIKN